jgi:hypothetical protein
MPILKTLAAAINGRWIREQAHQQMKEEFGSITSKGDHGKACTHDDERLCLPSAAASQAGEQEKRIHRGPPQRILPAVRRAVIKTLSQKQIYQRCVPTAKCTSGFDRNSFAKVV